VTLDKLERNIYKKLKKYVYLNQFAMGLIDLVRFYKILYKFLKSLKTQQIPQVCVAPKAVFSADRQMLILFAKNVGVMEFPEVFQQNILKNKMIIHVLSQQVVQLYILLMETQEMEFVEHVS